MRFVIEGDPRTKKNHTQIRYRTIPGTKDKRPFVAQNDEYKVYEEASIWQIPPVFKVDVDIPVNVRCVYYMKTRRRVDLVNLLEATCDILVRANVLKDDCADIVVGHDGSRVLYDKKNPRVEIEITKAVV